MRLELIGGMVTFLTSLFGVIGRDQNWGVSPEKLGLSISYALTVSAILNWLIWVTSELESNIVSVERIKEYTEVPQEVRTLFSIEMSVFLHCIYPTSDVLFFNWYNLENYSENNLEKQTILKLFFA